MASLELFKKVIIAILSTVLGTALVVYSISSVSQRFFFVPVLHYKKKIIRAINNGSDKLTKKTFGVKLGSLRRRIILASNNPSLYSTIPYSFTEGSNAKLSSSSSSSSLELTARYLRNTIVLQPCDVGIDTEKTKRFIDETRPRPIHDTSRKLLFGFFHPYCNAGGGGERVLWQAVHLTLNTSERNIAVIYTGDLTTAEEIIANVEKRFNLKLDHKRVVFIYLTKRYLVDGSYWRNWTLLGQAFGSIVLAVEAIYACAPDVWLDTMGYPFTYPIVYYLIKVPILSYTHFPIIQADMLNKLIVQFKTHKLPLFGKAKTVAKYVYWKIFLLIYSFVGYYIDVSLCNGTWTFNHLNDIWWMLDGTSKDENTVKTKILYPPCSTEIFIDTGDLKKEVSALISDKAKADTTTATIESRHDNNSFICLAQFRPEKRHDLIISEFAKFLKLYNPKAAQSLVKDSTPQLILIGSIRSDKDRQFVELLKAQSQELGITDNVRFILDAPYPVVEEHFKSCGFGLNAMWNEHFGIAVVESMASGLIPISHASAGPYLDIAVPWDIVKREQAQTSTEFTRTGFFFQSSLDPDYSGQKDVKFSELHQCFAAAIQLTPKERHALRVRGKACVLEKFSNAKFESVWKKCLEKLKKYDGYLREQKGKVEQVY